MTIKEALIQLDALAADLPADYEQELDDLATAEFILGQVEPRLSTAAFHHLMGRVARKRAQIEGEAITRMYSDNRDTVGLGS
jgi:hypothetical protein